MSRALSSVVLFFFISTFFISCGSGEKDNAANNPVSDSLSAVHLESAVKTANWLNANALTVPAGIEWRANPLDTASVYYSLYYGSPGIILFYLELYHATQDSANLFIAKQAANNLIANVSDRRSDYFTRDRTGMGQRIGLYTGISGIGFALEEVYGVTKEKKYRDGMMQCISMLKDSVQIKNNTASWSTTEDVLSGDAGTGLFLLYAFERTGDSSLKKLAVQVGNGLVKKGILSGAGQKWPMEPAFSRLMPNFSHGTAGICYFFLRLHEVTGDPDFLAAATKGADYLKKYADESGGLIFHHEGDGVHHEKCTGPACMRVDSCIGDKVFYLSWCHGPSGTSRFFYLMGQETKDPKWNERMETAAHSVMASGIPEKLTDGFWNSLGQCCGSAGVGEHFLTLYSLTQKKEYLDFAQHLASFLNKNSVAEGNGIKFPNAENNRERDVVYAQTGYSMGSAGIGIYFLHLYETEKGITPLVRFPDSPY